MVDVFPSGKAILIFFFLLMKSLLVYWYNLLTKKHNDKRKMFRSYQRKFLRKKLLIRGPRNRASKFQALGVLVFSYVGCSSPWIVVKLSGVFLTWSAGIQQKLGFIVLFVYSLNFVVASGVCFYLKCGKKKKMKDKHEWKRQNSYRMRDIQYRPVGLKRRVSSVVSQ